MSGLPQDLMLGSNKDTNDDPISLVKTGSNKRNEMETKAKERQKKQAKYLNVHCGWGTGVLPKWSIATVQMSSDKGKFTLSNLLILVCGLKHFQKSDSYQ